MTEAFLISAAMSLGGLIMGVLAFLNTRHATLSQEDSTNLRDALALKEQYQKDYHEMKAAADRDRAEFARKERALLRGIDLLTNQIKGLEKVPCWTIHDMAWSPEPESQEG